MEIEARFYYSLDSEDRLLNKLKNVDGLFYDDKYYEETLQYNHPMKEFDFYDKKIDGRFRVRKSVSSNNSKCMIKKLIENSITYDFLYIILEQIASKNDQTNTYIEQLCGIFVQNNNMTADITNIVNKLVQIAVYEKDLYKKMEYELIGNYSFIKNQAHQR